MKKSVEVLMSTYNGEKYIEKQIETIMNQIDVDVHLTIRDDGSTDGTIRIVRQLIDCYPDRIKVIEGKNIGYRRSFLETFNYAEEMEYYCFADQDDIWKPEKLIHAIEKLELVSDDIKLYVSSLNIVDENLKMISYKDISKNPNSIESYFTRGRFAGCTFVFSKELKDTIVGLVDFSIPEISMPDHDFFVASCAYAFGSVCVDRESYMLHIRHNDSVTSGGNGIKKRIKGEYNLLFRRKDVHYNMANVLLKADKAVVNGKTHIFLQLVASYKENLRNRLRLLMCRECTCGNFLCDIESKIKILLLNY